MHPAKKMWTVKHGAEEAVGHFLATYMPWITFGVLALPDPNNWELQTSMATWKSKRALLAAASHRNPTSTGRERLALDWPEQSFNSIALYATRKQPPSPTNLAPKLWPYHNIKAHLQSMIIETGSSYPKDEIADVLLFPGTCAVLAPCGSDSRQVLVPVALILFRFDTRSCTT